MSKAIRELTDKICAGYLLSIPAVAWLGHLSGLGVLATLANPASLLMGIGLGLAILSLPPAEKVTIIVKIG